MRAALIEVGARKFLKVTVRFGRMPPGCKRNRLSRGKPGLFRPLVRGGLLSAPRPHAIPDILGSNKEEETQQEEEKGKLNNLQQPGEQGVELARHDFDGGEDNVPAIEDRKRQHVENGKVHIEKNHEKQNPAPAALHAEHVKHHTANAHRARQVLNSDIGLRRHDFGQGHPHHAHTVRDLFQRTGMINRLRELVPELKAYPDHRWPVRIGGPEGGDRELYPRLSTVNHKRQLPVFSLPGDVSKVPVAFERLPVYREDLVINPQASAIGITGDVRLVEARARVDAELERIEQEALTRQKFEKMMSPNLVERVLSGELNIQKGGELRDVTVMFTDIRGFTELTEQTEAQACRRSKPGG